MDTAGLNMTNSLKTQDWAGAGNDAGIAFLQGLEDSSVGYILNIPVNFEVPEMPSNPYGPQKPSGFAEGGFPDEGSLFIAREAGPEFVGRMGSRTAVANNDQIVEAIREGVFDAMTAALNGQDQREVRVYLDGRELANSAKKHQNQMARALGV